MRKVLLPVCGLLLILVCCFMWLRGNGHTSEFIHSHLPRDVKVADTGLLLNGVGIRTDWLVDKYVAALYLTQKQVLADTIIADGQVHRVALHMMSDMTAADLLEDLNAGLEANTSGQQLNAVSVQRGMMTQAFKELKGLAPGDVITFDYVPATGTRISINSSPLVLIPGPSFNQALLKIWLGDKPLQDRIKKGLSG